MPKDSSDSDIFKIRKRLRLYGKPTSKDLLAREISKLLLGDGDKGIEPLNLEEIMSKIGYKRTQVQLYKKLAIELGYIEIDDRTKKAILPKRKKSFNWHIYSKSHKIINESVMEKWIDKQNLKKDGKLTITKPMIAIIEKICNTCKILPEELLSKDNAETYKTRYLTAWQKGEAWTPSGHYKVGSLAHMTLRVNYAIASFCGVHNISWETGSEIMSRRIVGHGDYADTKLTKEEFKKADTWIRKNHGLDSDLYRWFWVAVESGARFSALYEMDLEWTIHKTKSGKITFIMSVIEGKTIHINKGKWFKYIQRSKLQKSLTLLKNRGGTRIYESKLPMAKFRKEIHTQLKLMYDHLGKDGYFHEHPTHVLRHLACHRLLSKGNYTNHSIVAKMLGWNVVDEMIKSYGEIPPEKVLEEADKFEEDIDEDEDLDSSEKED